MVAYHDYHFNPYPGILQEGLGSIGEKGCLGLGLDLD